MTEWISVKEKRPDEGERVLVLYTDLYFNLAEFNGGKFLVDVDFYADPDDHTELITHWARIQLPQQKNAEK